MGFVFGRKRLAFLLFDRQSRIPVMAVHPLVSRIRQQVGFRVQQQAAAFEDGKVVLPPFAHHYGQDGQRQRADDQLGLNRVAFFFLSRRLSGL